ncbi:hypothetical protein SKAU_G00344890 [Synaphobranchus kaupii]|uniref:Uncharacterized protein n=1 Tax=Synaphobranchus kaupii TaxID=118154 RepID=A0A9Q1IHL1_SYNKA|nr:hypothetical protein SKAU_G00344890 [Synaphobranchus kaupii]
MHCHIFITSFSSLIITLGLVLKTLIIVLSTGNVRVDIAGAPLSVLMGSGLTTGHSW